tara:strand:- start:89 stop:427 length:339 start_codon:yes stop_codon:yes gene_type:complete
LEKVTKLYISHNQLTEVKGLEKLTQLKELYLDKNPNLIKAQVTELQKVLPNCKIYSPPPIKKPPRARYVAERLPRGSTDDLTTVVPSLLFNIPTRSRASKKPPSVCEIPREF